ncbi:MAG: ATP-binding cassette domain-containing protein [Duncaniella sp.]|nr:ATP-binding cassette domain-containing protein [Duncaniella sp.]
MIIGELWPSTGEVVRNVPINVIYLDQEYSFLNSGITIYEQLETYGGNKPEYELKVLLHRFLFPMSTWDKKCVSLSGGERLKLSLCCLLVSEKTPDIIIADEPTNNIDISSMDILVLALREYSGTLLIVSHNEQFVQDVGITRTVRIE